MTIEEKIRQRRIEIQNSVADNIMKGFGVDIEKARSGTYVDNSENRRLMRVGQKYGESSNTFRPGSKVRVTLPTGKVIKASYVEPYAKDRHTVKDEDGKLYGVTTDKIEKISGQSKRKMSFSETSKIEEKMDDLHQQIVDLKRERKNLEIDMEEELSQLSEEERYNGNNKTVAYYGLELDRIDNQINSVTNKYNKYKQRLKG